MRALAKARKRPQPPAQHKWARDLVQYDRVVIEDRVFYVVAVADHGSDSVSLELRRESDGEPLVFTCDRDKAVEQPLTLAESLNKSRTFTGAQVDLYVEQTVRAADVKPGDKMLAALPGDGDSPKMEFDGKVSVSQVQVETGGMILIFADTSTEGFRVIPNDTIIRRLHFYVDMLCRVLRPIESIDQNSFRGGSE